MMVSHCDAAIATSQETSQKQVVAVKKKKVFRSQSISLSTGNSGSNFWENVILEM